MKKFLLSLAAVLLLALPSYASVRVMSYNVRLGVAKDGDNAWGKRRSATPAMLNDICPAVFGVQEAYDFQIQYILEACPEYKAVGVGRDNGKSEGEHMSVFYDSTRIELLEWGTYWLSETPDVPSFGWDAACRRTATWTLLRDIASGQRFYFVNTHLDHKGKLARKNGLALIYNRIQQMNPEGLPMVLTGDFNVLPDDEGLKDLNTLMKSARFHSEDADRIGSFNGFGKYGFSTGAPDLDDSSAEKSTLRPLDYIYFSGFDRSLCFKVVTKTYDGKQYISDHYPVYADLVFSDAMELIREDYSRAAANYHAYEAYPGSLTPAPEGYEPFYISHYGRHGSRYLTYESAYKYLISHLEDLRDAGLLNETGDELLLEARSLYSYSKPRMGRLTPKGCEEHKAIAGRMYERFPEVFAVGSKVSATSSTSRRCKTSMVQFMSELTRRETTLDVDLVSSSETMRFISPKVKSTYKEKVKYLLDSLQRTTLCPEKVLAPLVSDLSGAMKVLHHPDKLEKALYDCAAICQCMPTDIDLMQYLPYEEGCKLWSLKNKQQFMYHGNTAEYGQERLSRIKPLAADIVSKAEKAISGNGASADLRFGHDGTLIPLECLLGVEGFHEVLHERETDRWLDFRVMCMGSNLQLVFYRNVDGDVLVQVLQNEREVTIPSLGHGPFYSWSDVRSRLVSSAE
ncbi:MAG: hypothetical protein IJU68_08165 [Bacteroidales bacterium]|nr:hypothetical protein [Bacteroidales bacterium]